MYDLLTSSAWALESKYYNVAKSAILARLEAGLPALDASEAKPRQYSHLDAKGYPMMWHATAGGVPGVCRWSQKATV